MNLLILLIGGNNIANYALVKYFKENGDDRIEKATKVLLICSDETKSSAQTIQKMQKEVDIDILDLGDYESNLSEIKKQVSEKLKQLKPSNIHLNYTGGRKPMSLGSYLAVYEYENNDINKVYSDISPKDYKLTLEDGSIYLEKEISSQLEISIEEFCYLHGFEKLEFKTQLDSFYNPKFKDFLLKQCLKNETEFYINLWDKDFKKLKELNWKESIEKFINEDLSNKRLKELQCFIKGTWLENYIYDMINSIKEDCGITDIAWNVEVKKKKQNSQDDGFELDIFVVCGYKSYVFTCTTMTKKKGVIKQKAFEGHERSVQVGGRGSQTILVCLANDETINAIKEDMENSTKIENNFQVIGREDIKDEKRLKDRLISIFKQG